MSKEVQWRLEFARECNERLSPLRQPGYIRACAVGGSVARGFSDVYSDIELLLLWENPPDSQLQREVMAVLNAEYRLPAADPAHNSAFLVRGVPVDIWHLTFAVEEATLRQVLEEYNLDLVANNRLDTFRNCIPLYGHAILNEWKTRIDNYPEELAHHFLKVYLPHFHLRQLNLVARRDNPTVFYHTLTDIQCSLFIILLALNNEYFPTFKWMYPLLESFKVGPEDVSTRLRRMFESPSLEVIGQLHSILSETLTIIEERYPKIDTGFARYSLEQTPYLYGRPDPGTKG